MPASAPEIAIASMMWRSGEMPEYTAARSLLPKHFPPKAITGPIVIVDHHHAHDDFGIEFRGGKCKALQHVILGTAHYDGTLFTRVGCKHIVCRIGRCRNA